MKNKRTEDLKEILNFLIEKIQDDCFDAEDKAFFLEEATKILAMIYDMNKAL